ncbi:hypothetical protein LEM8419_00259 [Neolewinella maritima]|uniref:Glycosyltransferase n=1 Tax=Neolewinella maritima TaxID=1383882 RepID=A0ABN8F4G7_9BACT|nr:hypothetical protein [Neolewinella maritima]CAH0998964.1 hypothetical protein LEM8419_00259 [Neolewinella maritima]
MQTNILVVIRAVDERTLELCEKLVGLQVPAKNIVTIKISPFSEAVRKTYQLGIQRDLPWTLAIDADVLVFPGAIKKMVDRASKYGAKLYSYQGLIKDKMLGSFRSAGPHLYNTDLLGLGVKALEETKDMLRPESRTYIELGKLGYQTIFDTLAFGVHDYAQTYEDYFRKAYFHAKKISNDTVTMKMLNYWQKNIDKDPDFKVMYQGWVHGRIDTSSTVVDSRFFKTITAQEFPKLGIQEKAPLHIDMGTWLARLAEYEAESADVRIPLKRIPNSKMTDFKRLVKVRTKQLIGY